ncbi:reverse transcriptase domain-containing protein [Tanacetum coccineum]|uniref:Reverse transcriptase domain-containing protein n=1 Tax=Tanacetum coccineum TaxID=301880 RepID=A0ABQ5HB02_9ASTR
MKNTPWRKRLEEILYKTKDDTFATCTLHGVALTWWKSHVKTVGQDDAHSMPWNTLTKMMTAKYCPRNEIKKLEMEIWELKVKVLALKYGDKHGITLVDFDVTMSTSRGK